MEAQKKHDHLKEPTDILILADFSDGLWDAVTFTVTVLYREGITIKLLETFEEPHTGQSLMLDLEAILENIANQELMAVKKRIVTEFKIPGHDIKLISHNGDLISFLKQEDLHGNILCTVVNTHSSFSGSCFMQKFKIWKLVRKVSRPMFVFPVEFSYSDIYNIVYAVSPMRKPSESILNELAKLFQSVDYKIHILFFQRKNKKENERAESEYLAHPLSSKFTFHYIDRSKLIPEVIRNMDELNGNLFVMDRLHGSVYRKYIRSCIWGQPKARKMPVLFI